MDERVDVPLYVGGATIQDGAFLPAGREDKADPLTSWASVDPQRITVPAGGREMATVRIVVPPDAPNGERYGVVWAELPAGGGEVEVVNRVGVRIYLSVGVGEEPASDFELDSLQASRSSSGEPVVSARVTNTGGRALDFGGELLLLEGPGGATAGPFTAERGRTLGVGQATDVTVILDPGLPAGPWLARMTLWSGGLERSAEATIVFPEEAGTASAPVDATPVYQDRGLLLPLATGLVTLALLLVLLVWLLARRRRSEEEAEPVVAGSEQRITT